MDIAVRDERAGVTGWVFGTFAYDKDSEELDPWDRMMPVGLMWGNDPTLTDAKYQAGSRPQETVISELAPKYAANHLGRSNRMNGPVDNPASSCLSCHSTAQVPTLAPMTPLPSCTEGQVMQWFRNLTGEEPFGAIDRNSCQLEILNRGDLPVAIDYSLQVAAAIANQLTPDAVNSCNPSRRPIAPSVAQIQAVNGVDVYEVER